MKYNIRKKQSWLKIGLVAVTALVFTAFWLVGYDMPYEEDADFNAPLLTDMLMGYIYLLLAVCIGVTVYSVIHGIKTSGDRASRRTVYRRGAYPLPPGWQRQYFSP